MSTNSASSPCIQMDQHPLEEYPSLSQMIADIDKSIENAATEAHEAAVNTVLPSVNTVLKCRICNLEALEYITCSLCSMFVHFNCNIPKVSNYYRNKPDNFKCQFCKTKK